MSSKINVALGVTAVAAFFVAVNALAFASDSSVAGVVAFNALCVAVISGCVLGARSGL